MKVFIDTDGGAHYCFTHMLFCKHGEATPYTDRRSLGAGDELHIVTSSTTPDLNPVLEAIYMAAIVAVPIFFHSEYAITCKECAKTSFRPKSSKVLVEEIDQGWEEL